MEEGWQRSLEQPFQGQPSSTLRAPSMKMMNEWPAPISIALRLASSVSASSLPSKRTLRPEREEGGARQCGEAFRLRFVLAHTRLLPLLNPSLNTQSPKHHLRTRHVGVVGVAARLAEREPPLGAAAGLRHDLGQVLDRLDKVAVAKDEVEAVGVFDLDDLQVEL